MRSSISLGPRPDQPFSLCVRSWSPLTPGCVSSSLRNWLSCCPKWLTAACTITVLTPAVALLITVSLFVGIGLMTIPIFLLYQWLSGMLGISLIMAILTILLAYIASALAGYLTGLVGSSNMPISGVTVTLFSDPNGDGALTGACYREIFHPLGTTGVTTCPPGRCQPI